MLPPLLALQIKRIMGLYKGKFSELHITLGNRSSLLFLRKRIYLSTHISNDDMRFIMNKLCRGALYAYRDTITEGYISMSGGVRVGICGQARYENGVLVGVSDISSFNFRIPTAASSLVGEIYDAWKSSDGGMIIYSPPAGGKTTALRSLCCMLAEENQGVKISVIDERAEFIEEDCRRHGIDLFRGYKRADGMRIALRSMAPDVIIVDEISGNTESEQMLDSLNSGVGIIATAHADSVESLMQRRSFLPFLEHKIFDTFVGIFNTDGRYYCKTEKIKC